MATKHQSMASQIRARRQVKGCQTAQINEKLCGRGWQNFVASDEAMFYLGGSYGRRRVCYLRKGEKPSDKLKYVKRVAFASGFMAWAGVSFRGKTDIRIIDKGTEVNSKIYIKNVLKPFLDKDVPRLFPCGSEEMVFHQDGASRHTSKETLQYLRNRNVNFIKPEEWMPQSPDAAPVDFGIWGILKRRLQKRNINSLLGLEKALKDEWQKLDQETINKTLAS